MKKVSAFALFLVVLLLFAAAVSPVALAQGTTGDKVVTGGSYTLSQGETLDGNLAVLGGSAMIENGATVQGDVSVLGGSLVVDGTITGNVSLLGGSVQLNEGAVVDGNVANLAGSVQRAPGSQIHGDTFNGLNTPNRIVPAPIAPSFTVQRDTPGGWFGRFIGWQLGTIGSILLMGLLGLVLILVAPRGVGRVASAAASQPGLSFVLGILTMLLGLLAGAILLIACGLGLLVWLALVAGFVLGWVAIALGLGQRILRGLKTGSASSIVEVLVGVVIITFLTRIPCVGWLFWLIFASWGLGAVVLTRFGTQDATGPAPRPAPVIPGGGSGGNFAPLPETSDLVTAPVAPPAVPVAPVPPADVALAEPAATEPAAEPVPLEPSAIDDTGVAVLPELPETAGTLTDVQGIDAGIADKLQAAGIHTVADLAVANPVELAAATGLTVGQIMTEDWIGQAQRLA